MYVKICDFVDSSTPDIIQKNRLCLLMLALNSSRLLWGLPRSFNLHEIQQFHLAYPQAAMAAAPLSLPAFRSFLPFTLPAITTIILIFTEIWEAILRAVPKKKTSHSKKRKRQLVGKALKDKQNLSRCEACGDWKLLHTLCSNCVRSIQKGWRRRERLVL
jgi:large subunit ribosomal protein L32